jgi:hypothetical protein
MSTMSHRRVVATLATGALLGLPAVSLADPPADSASMYRYSHAPLVKDYSKNAAGGDYAPARRIITPIHDEIGPAATTTSDGFAWGDAAAGAGIALLIGGVGLGGRMVVRRHRTVAGVTP